MKKLGTKITGKQYTRMKFKPQCLKNADSKARDESAPVTERRKKTTDTPHTISGFLFTVSSVVYLRT
jgi:hypothetical protein